MREVRRLPQTARVLVVTKHAGRGDEPGFGYSVYPTRRGLVVAYWATTGYCPHYGTFEYAAKCDIEGHTFECVPWAEAREHFPQEVVDAATRILRRGTVENIRLDLTGHAPVRCKYDGGCIICHPCYHDECCQQEE